VAFAPTIALRTPLAQKLIRHQVGLRGFAASYQKLHFGWLTPLHATGLELVGTSAGTKLEIERLDCDRSLLRLWMARREPIRVSAQGVRLSTTLHETGSSLETDLLALLSDSEEASSSTSGANQMPDFQVDIQNLSILAIDTAREEIWAIDQGRGTFGWSANGLAVEASGILSDPHTGSGSFDAAVQLDPEGDQDMVLVMKLQTLPLRVVPLVGRWLPDSAAAVPAELSGDASGSIRLVGSPDGAWSVEAERFELRNFVAKDPRLGQRVWQNDLAVIDGAAEWRGSGVIGRGFTLATDFSEVRLDGTFLAPTESLAEAGPMAWLSTLNGTAVAAIDLPLMDQRLPGFLPLRSEAQLISGKLMAEIVSQADPAAATGGGARLVDAVVRSEPIRAERQGRVWSIEPASVTANLRVDPATGVWRAERCEFASVFGKATLDGEWTQGRARGEIDLSRLAAMLEPLFDLPDLRLGGNAAGEMTWAAQADDRWSLQADAEATELTLLLPGGIRLHRPKLTVHADVVGQLSGTQLIELTAAELSLRSTSLEADAVLTQSVSNPTAATQLPLRLTGRGRLEVLAEFLGPWMPASLHDLRGGFEGQVEALAGLSSGELSSANVRLEDPRGAWGDQRFAQRQLGVDFDGHFHWPSGDLVAKSMTLTGEAVSAVVKGQLTTEISELEFAWRASLQRLQESVQTQIASSPRGNAPPGGQPAEARLASSPGMSTPTADWAVRGNCEGSGRIHREPNGQRLIISHRIVGSQLQYLQIDPANPRTAPEVLWAEPSLEVDGQLSYNPETGFLLSDQMKVRTDWFATHLGGEIRPSSARDTVRLKGPARIDMDRLSPRLSEMCGLAIRLEGTHETPLEISLDLPEDGSMPLKMLTSIGWEQGEIAGLILGPCSAPLTISETTMTIAPTTIPVDPGEIHVAAQLHYSSGPLWLDVKPGSGAKNLRLTRELSDRWLQYLAPMVARATRVEGSFGVELSEARVNLSEPTRSRVRGQLQISQIRCEAGPVSQQLVTSVQQIRMLSRGRSLVEAQAGDGTNPEAVNLVVLPTQTVDFDFTDGVVGHQRMFLQIDRVRLITSGQVTVDGRLNLITQVPLEASWLGSDLQSLAGATVSLPITGTLSQPRLDPSGIRNLAGQLGVQAIQSSAENYLEKQLNRGLDRLLGR